MERLNSWTRTVVKKFLGVSISSTEEKFEIRTYPKAVRDALTKSFVPQDLYPNALAVIGKALFEVKKLWGDRVSDANLQWETPSFPDFDQAAKTLDGLVGRGEILGLASEIFGNTNTSGDIKAALYGQIKKILDESSQK